MTRRYKLGKVGSDASRPPIISGSGTTRSYEEGQLVSTVVAATADSDDDQDSDHDDQDSDHDAAAATAKKRRTGPPPKAAGDLEPTPSVADAKKEKPASDEMDDIFGEWG